MTNAVKCKLHEDASGEKEEQVRFSFFVDSPSLRRCDGRGEHGGECQLRFLSEWGSQRR